MWCVLETCLLDERGVMVMVFAAVGAGIGLRVAVGRLTGSLGGRGAARPGRA
jgi:hypothetical protein